MAAIGACQQHVYLYVCTPQTFCLPPLHQSTLLQTTDHTKGPVDYLHMYVYVYGYLCMHMHL